MGAEAAGEGVNLPDELSACIPINTSLRSHHTLSNRTKLSRHIRIILQKLDLRTCRILIRKCINKLRLAPRQLGLLFKHLHRLRDLALLQAELSECGDGCFAFGVDSQGFVTTPFGGADVLFPLVQGEAAIDERENIRRGSSERGKVFVRR